MNTYQHALHISPGDFGRRIEVACEIVASGEGTVVLYHKIALYLYDGVVICEVFGTPSDEIAYRELIAEAKQLLGESPLHGVVAALPQEWVVVEDYGNGRVALFHDKKIG